MASKKNSDVKVEMFSDFTEPVIVLDIESTGLYIEAYDEPIEVCAIRCWPDGREEIFHEYIKPYRSLPRKITELTGITPEMLANCENKYKILPRLSKFIDGAIVIGHSVRFDVTMLNFWFLELSLPLITNRICTMDNYRVNTGSKHLKLTDACSTLGIPLVQAHSAIEDTRATAKLFKFMFGQYKKLVLTRKSEKEAFIEVFKRTAKAKNFTLIRNTLCISGISMRTTTLYSENAIVNLFEKFKTPVEVAAMCSNEYSEILRYFAEWINKIRISKVYRIVSNHSISKIVDRMVSRCDTFDELIELHKIVFETDDINLMVYVTYFVLAKADLKYSVDDFNYFFENSYTCLQLCNRINKPKEYIEDFFVLWAEQNKTTKREQISNYLVKKPRLRELLSGNAPNTFEDAVSLKLYNRDFFKITTISEG